MKHIKTYTRLFGIFLLFNLGISACQTNKIVLKEKEKEKLIEGHWSNKFKYVDFVFQRGGKENYYKIQWPGSRIDTGIWRIANNGIILKSEMEGTELYGDVVKIDEETFVVQFENGEEYELKRVDDKNKNN
ncbi:MAG: hypothetical protein EAZ55_03005 [Cytophagales bacterium]|nr:MAG: hypothetical protein EAZ55_03005 [Cytophagales bacterium]